MKPFTLQEITQAHPQGARPPADGRLDAPAYFLSPCSRGAYSPVGVIISL